MTEFGGRRVWLLVVAFGMAASDLQAREVNARHVAMAVETWVRKVPSQARPNAVIEKLEPYQEGGRTVAYIAHLAGGGFCLCGADDQLLPVYLYDPADRYDPADPDLLFILRSIPEHRARIQAGREKRSSRFERYAPKLAVREEAWQSLISGEAPVSPAATTTEAPTMVTVPANFYWSQGGLEGGPFAEACPALPPGGDSHCVVGCTGTATSMILYYWKWPVTGEGDASVVYRYRAHDSWLIEPLTDDPGIPVSWNGRLEWQVDNGGELRMAGYWDNTVYGSASAIDDSPEYQTALSALWGRMTQYAQEIPAHPGATTYGWSLMLDNYAGVPFDDPAAVAVMNLCRDVAVTANTVFGLRGSSAYISNARNALVNHFRCDPDAVVLSRDTDLMIEEFQWLRPVQMAGGDGQGAGHAWMTCGYDTGPEPDLFLVNRGHGGGSTEWLAIDEYWASDQIHITRIAPQGVVRFVGNTVSGDGSPANPFENIAAALSSVDDGTTLIFKAGSINTFAGTSLTIGRPMTLKGWNVSIQAQ